MIIFKELCNETPYQIFKDYYDRSIKFGQKNIEASCISSYSKKSNEVNARFVNLKFINKKRFIFFSNYNSPKSKEFKSHSQITATIFWNSIDIQIRMKAIIKKTPKKFNNHYFQSRDQSKNALAISSEQSMPIKSYQDIQERYLNVLKSEDLCKCPDHWGGFSFMPYYFEFWEGHKSRLNNRKVYEKKDNGWTFKMLQP